MKLKFLAALFLVSGFIVTACANSSSYLPIEKIPASNSQEIQVDKAYDFVYLAVFDAVNNLADWTPGETLKDEGLIRVKNTQFSRLDDSVSRVVDVRIRRDNQKQTSVFLDADSRRVIGADEVLDAIRKKLGVSAA